MLAEFFCAQLLGMPDYFITDFSRFFFMPVSFQLIIEIAGKQIP